MVGSYAVPIILNPANLLGWRTIVWRFLDPGRSIELWYISHGFSSCTVLFNSSSSSKFRPISVPSLTCFISVHRLQLSIYFRSSTSSTSDLPPLTVRVTHIPHHFSPWLHLNSPSISKTMLQFLRTRRMLVSKTFLVILVLVLWALPHHHPPSTCKN